ncbi:hypothetical protein KPL47_15080 [Clostridium estertheticum]|uniref:hypothetical protein n=1 Tax=Clostridium estertheticum TaxID=238834 RepID=UPI001C0C6646|nr:hypothetical protein [Clostridium estertheticum]MBU3177656.1 hypothetical protein [Clostridium estertheticum]
MVQRKTAYDTYMDGVKNEYRHIYGDIVNRVWNLENLSQLNDVGLNPLIVFELLDKVYCDLALVYKLDYRIIIQTTSISFMLEWISTYITIRKDDYDNKIYIVVPDFNLPKRELNKLNETKKNSSYFRNGYRIIKILEVICKCWKLDGIIYKHIVNCNLAATLRSEGYDNIYKLRGDSYFPDQDYVKWMLNDDEINKKYQIEYELKKPSSFKSIVLKKFKNIVSRLQF